jgi:hypothetical protein
MVYLTFVSLNTYTVCFIVGGVNSMEVIDIASKARYMTSFYGHSLPVGRPRTKYLPGPGLNSLIRLTTYLADHDVTSSGVSSINSFIFSSGLTTKMFMT